MTIKFSSIEFLKLSEPAAGSLSVPRGMPSGRRNQEVSRIARPTPTRPAPIVWNRNGGFCSSLKIVPLQEVFYFHLDTPERGRASGLGRTRGRGRARSNPLRRGRL
jgi:hypothetical protein